MAAVNGAVAGLLAAASVVLAVGPTACTGDGERSRAVGPCELIAGVLPDMAERGTSFEDLLVLDPLDDVDGLIPGVARALAASPDAADRYAPALRFIAQRAYAPSVDDVGPLAPDADAVASARALDEALRAGMCEEEGTTG